MNDRQAARACVVGHRGYLQLDAAAVDSDVNQLVVIREYRLASGRDRLANMRSTYPMFTAITDDPYRANAHSVAHIRPVAECRGVITTLAARAES